MSNTGGIATAHSSYRRSARVLRSMSLPRAGHLAAVSSIFGCDEWARCFPAASRWTSCTGSGDVHDTVAVVVLFCAADVGVRVTIVRPTRGRHTASSTVEPSLEAGRLIGLGESALPPCQICRSQPPLGRHTVRASSSRSLSRRYRRARASVCEPGVVPGTPPAESCPLLTCPGPSITDGTLDARSKCESMRTARSLSPVRDLAHRSDADGRTRLPSR